MAKSSAVLTRRSQSTKGKFNPNALTFNEGVMRVQSALRAAKVDISKRIITSKDKDAIKLVNMLGVDNVPGGFKKWQLPIVLRDSQLFISVGAADAVVPKHSHDEGDGIRFIVSGSILYNGKELSSGDWMYIPQGKEYSFRVGPLGVSMCYCYCCCCAGRIELTKGDWVMKSGGNVRA